MFISNFESGKNFRWIGNRGFANRGFGESGKNFKRIGEPRNWGIEEKLQVPWYINHVSSMGMTHFLQRVNISAFNYKNLMDDLCSGVSILRPEFLLSHIMITKSHLKSLNFKVLACNFLSFVLKAGVLSISLTPNIPKNMHALWTTLLWNIDNGILNTFSIWDSLKPAGDVPTLTQTILKLNALNIMLCSVAYLRCIPQKLINLIAMLEIYLLENPLQVLRNRKYKICT